MLFLFMEFEFDEAKSESNLRKHGIDFVSAQQLWLDSDVVEVPARTVDEPRFLVVGKISDKHWSAVITYRGDIRRIISVRRSRTSEVEIYEGE
ncbi:MAG: BrnT family toxin [Spirochaetes bacterium]|nr:BrnT family toxin [Spirochaetota bacterium]